MSKPLIKWPGGKGTEIQQFLPLIPAYDRYIEPFVGGGALYFYLEPESAVINDISESLMDFYALVREEDAEFHRLLDMYCRSFDALKNQCEKHARLLRILFDLYVAAQQQGIDVRAVAPHLHLTKKIACDESVLSELIIDEKEYLQIMQHAVEDKLIRTAKHHVNKSFSEKDLQNNLMTGFTSGFYLYFREVFNQIGNRSIIASRQYRAANFYFVREYCYGAMFRYNRDGNFNIPYGGMSYNQKDLRAKVDRMFLETTVRLLKRTQLYHEDFEGLMEHMDLTERDFLFLDPPYDTDFSDYEGKAFAHEDHARLARFLERTKAQFLLVIKNTDYIYSLYEGKFRILSFENRYLYNVRSRNDRRSEHLIITNIPEGNVPWLQQNVTI